MSETKQNREQELFEAASQKLDLAERRAFLDEACRADPTLRARLELLLEGHFEGEGFLTRNPEPTAQPKESSPAEPLPPALGHYQLLEKLGEGGFGEVWMAEQEKPVKRRVAVKILKLGMDTQQVVKRFEAERQVLALMDHPSIARVLDAGATDTGRPYFVMDLVRGVRITDYCDQNNLSTPQRLDLFIQVCQAIQHAHQKGIIHRDIKPSNILVALHDGVPVPKVIDFGIAKATQRALTDQTLFTQFQQFIGTPTYVSPEQAEMSGLDIDTRSDIYSLGVLLYELLVGRTPYDAKELMQGGLEALRKMFREREPQRPSTKLNTLTQEERTTTARRRQTDAPRLVHLLRGDLDWIVMKCLERDRTRRYETTNGLVMDIQHHLAHEPVSAGPPSKLYRARKFVRRHRVGVAFSVSFVVVLVAGLVFALAGLAAVRRSRNEAQAAQKTAETERERANAHAQEATESRRELRRRLYTSDIKLAQLAGGDAGKARRLLDRYRPQPGEEDLRGWEWRYLWQVTRSSALVTLTNRPVRGTSVSFSPDGTHLAVGWQDGRVDLWDVPGWRRLRALTDRDYAHRGRVAFSPVRNLLAATSEPKVVTLYDLDSGLESALWRAPDEGNWDVRNLAFSQDGSKLVLYAGSSFDGSPRRTPELNDAIWVVNVSSARVESRLSAPYSGSTFFSPARLSPDSRRLYVGRSDGLKSRCSIQCIDFATGNELWQTEPQRDKGLAALAVSQDGRLLASSSGYEDSNIYIWEAETGRLLIQLKGHTTWIEGLEFARDGRRLISASADQSIRFWDTETWKQVGILRGHTMNVQAVAISGAAQLLASVGADGNLMLWRDNAKNGSGGHRQLPENLRINELLALDQARVLLLPPNQPPQLLDLKRDVPPVLLTDIGDSSNVLGRLHGTTLCHWDGTNRIVISELSDLELIHRGSVSVESGLRPIGAAFNTAKRLLAWSESRSSKSVFLASLGSSRRRVELGCDASGVVPLRFSDDGNFLVAALNPEEVPQFCAEGLRCWEVETGRLLASASGPVRDFVFTEGGQVLVVTTDQGLGHEIAFYDLAHPERPPKRVPGRNWTWSLSVSPDGRLVAASSQGNFVRLYDSLKSELIASLDGFAHSVAFAPDGRRLASASGASKAATLWDVGTRQEFMNLSGTGSMLSACQWSADGNVLLAGPPWQAWIAPSWEEIAAAESQATSPSSSGSEARVRDCWAF